jgi:hypothetical protein
LIGAVIDHAEGRVEQIHLHVVTTNAPAYDLYRSVGFATYSVDLRKLYFVTALPSKKFNRPVLVGRHGRPPDAYPEHALLQRRQNASIIGQRCAGLSPSSAGPGASPLRPGLGFRYTQVEAFAPLVIIAHIAGKANVTTAFWTTGFSWLGLAPAV